MTSRWQWLVFAGVVSTVSCTDGASGARAPGEDGALPDAAAADATDAGADATDAGTDATDAAGAGDAAPFYEVVDGGAADAAAPIVTIDTYPIIDGATSTLPLARVVACELLGLPWRWELAWDESNQAYLQEVVPDPQTPEQTALAARVTERIVHSKTHESYVRLIDGRAELILVASKPSADENALARQAGVHLELRAVALDAIVFIVNASNPVTTLTSEQVRRIYTGELTRWAEVGGLAGQPIAPYARPENSGSQQLMTTIVMPGLTMPNWPPDRVPAGMGGMIDGIAADPNSIGYTVFFYLQHMVENGGVKMIAIDGKAATPRTIGARTYPYAAEVWMATRTDLAPGSLAAQLRDWLVSPGGQTVVAKSQFVPVEE